MLSFAFDADNQTPESIKRRREMILALQPQFGRAQNVGEGIGQALTGLGMGVGKWQTNKAEKAGMAGGQDRWSGIMGALGGGGAQNAPVAAHGAGAPQGDMSSYRDAIAGIESAGSGDYSAIGPTHPKMGRALGRYQVMESNIGPWSEAALGQAISPEQFLADPKLQDAIFDHQFGQYVQKFGPEGAAQAWFAGPGGVGKTGRKDVLGTTVGDYGRRFSQALGGGTQVASLDPSAGMPAPQMAGAPPMQPQGIDPQQQIAQAMIAPNNAGNVGMPGPGGGIVQAQGALPPPPPAMPQGQQMAQASGIDLNTLMQAAGDPWLPDAAKPILKLLIEQEMQKSDPMRQMQLEKGRLEIDQLRNPKSDPFTLSPGEIRFGPDGKQIATGGVKPRDLPSAVQEYEYAKEQGFPGTFHDWEASKKGGMSLQVDPETGAVTFQQGANIKPLTEGQSKDTVYATRAEGALPLIDQFGDALTSLPETMGGQVPGVGNYMKSPEFQQAEQAGKEFLQAILRKDTGAAITAQEVTEYGTVYLPRPGDSPEVLAQKRVSRQRALEAIKAGMPAQAILMQEKALANTNKKATVVIDGYTIEEVE